MRKRSCHSGGWPRPQRLRPQLPFLEERERVGVKDGVLIM